MIQLVVLVTIDNEILAYRYASNDIDELLEQEKRVDEKVKNIPLSFSSHTLSTSGPSIQSLQEEDPYFDGIIDYTNFEEFLKVVEKKSMISDEEVAGYLKSHFNLHTYPLQKVLYYSFADYLVKYGKQPFSATFEAFDHGPVDRQVWLEGRDMPVKLESKASDFIQKSSFRPEIKNDIDSAVKKYADYFDKNNSFENSSKNPTHNIGTPWERAYRLGRNTIISTENIKKYHYLEEVK